MVTPAQVVTTIHLYSPKCLKRVLSEGDPGREMKALAHRLEELA
jgi:hypothetical protein